MLAEESFGVLTARRRVSEGFSNENMHLIWVTTYLTHKAECVKIAQGFGALRKS